MVRAMKEMGDVSIMRASRRLSRVRSWTRVWDRHE